MPARAGRSRARPAREANPRWARHDTARHLRPRRQPVRRRRSTAASPALVAQLTDVGPKKREPRLTDSQKFIRDEEEKLIELEGAEGQEEEGRGKGQAGQAAGVRAPGPPDGHRLCALARRHARLRPRRRAAGRREDANVPNYVTETGYTEDIPARTFVGDAQDRRLLAVLNLETGKTAWADAQLRAARRRGVSPVPPARATRHASDKAGGPPAPPSARLHEQAARGRTPKKAERDIRWAMPAVSDDGKLAVASARSADNKDRWLVDVDPETGKTRVVDALHDDAWVREAGGGFGAGGRRVRCPTEARLVPLRARRLDAPLHARRDADAARSRAQLTRASGRSTSARALARQQEVLPHEHRSASGRAAHLRDAGRRRRAHEADVDDRRRTPARSRPTTARSGSSTRPATSRTRCT